MGRSNIPSITYGKEKDFLQKETYLNVTSTHTGIKSESTYDAYEQLSSCSLLLKRFATFARITHAPPTQQLQAERACLWNIPMPSAMKELQYAILTLNQRQVSYCITNSLPYHALVVKSVSVGSSPPSAAFSQVQASVTVVSSPAVGWSGVFVAYRLPSSRTNRPILAHCCSPSLRDRSYIRQLGEPLRRLGQYVTFITGYIAAPKEETMGTVSSSDAIQECRDGCYLRHEQRAPATVFSVVAFSQVQ